MLGGREGGGKWLLYVFLNVDYDALHFHMRSLKINIFKVLVLAVFFPAPVTILHAAPRVPVPC